MCGTCVKWNKAFLTAYVDFSFYFSPKTDYSLLLPFSKARKPSLNKPLEGEVGNA